MTSPATTEDEDGFLTRISVKLLLSSGSDFRIGVVCHQHPPTDINEEANKSSEKLN